MSDSSSSSSSSSSESSLWDAIHPTYNYMNALDKLKHPVIISNEFATQKLVETLWSRVITRIDTLPGACTSTTVLCASITYASAGISHQTIKEHIKMLFTLKGNGWMFHGTDYREGIDAKTVTVYFMAG